MMEQGVWQRQIYLTDVPRRCSILPVIASIPVKDTVKVVDKAGLLKVHE